MPAGFPASDCVLHKLPVASMNALNWAHIIPNLVGNPNSKPSASASSLGVMIGASPFGGACIFSRTSLGNVSGTCLNMMHTHSSGSNTKTSYKMYSELSLIKLHNWWTWKSTFNYRLSSLFVFNLNKASQIKTKDSKSVIKQESNS